MKKYLIAVLVLIMAVALVFAAKPNTTRNAATNDKSDRSVIIPANAIQIEDNVFSLGQSIDKDGRVVEGYAFVHYSDKKGEAKPSGGKPGATKCYGFLASSAKWKTIEPYIIDPTNTDGLNDSFIRNNVASDIYAWESAAGKNILGDEVSGVVDGADETSPDNKNELYFGSISDSGVIAVTIVWGIFGGPPAGRELVEWDMVLDQADFDWTEDALIETNKMDFWNIAIHELGHSVGMDDLYTTGCSEETMYGYATEGETKKRDLNTGDIAGIRKLYS